ncbi:protein kinase domain-containing protein [Gordonia sp. NPDC003504]
MSTDDRSISDRSGTTLGPYSIGELLGRGGMGQVYRATDNRKGRVVALKLLNPDLVDNDTFRDRFERESRIAAKLNDPHVVPIHDWGEIDGLLYIDMRLVNGTDLRGILNREGALPPTRAVAILAQAAEALDAAHADGLVHRDVKPDNILVDTRDFAYLADFGLAQADTDTRLTTAGAAIGSFAYMAPERFGPGEVGAAGDVYALACVLYETLSGSQPFVSATTFEQLIAAHLNQDPPQLGSPIDPVIARGMAKQPGARFPTAGALIDAARAAYEGATGHHRISPPTILPAGPVVGGGTGMTPPGSDSPGKTPSGRSAPSTRSPAPSPAGRPAQGGQAPGPVRLNKPSTPVAGGYTSAPPTAPPQPAPSQPFPSQPFAPQPQPTPSGHFATQSAPYAPTGHYTYPAPAAPPRRTSPVLIILIIIALLLVAGIGIGAWALVRGSNSGGGADTQVPGAAGTTTQPVIPTVAPTTPAATTAPTTIAPTIATPTTATPTTAAPTGRAAFDLGLSTPISIPACDGTGIVVVGNAVNEATWASEVQGYLNAYPGSSYLRTDQSCSSLRRRDDNGNVIYAVYQVAGRTIDDICRLRNQLGGQSYGKWLDNTTDPTTNIPAAQCGG